MVNQVIDMYLVNGMVIHGYIPSAPVDGIQYGVTLMYQIPGGDLFIINNCDIEYFTCNSNNWI